ncbi:hypothetical protein D3C78_1213920 [compost metagenome]
MGEDNPLLVVHVRLLLVDELLQPGRELIQRDDGIHQDHLHHLLELGTGLQQAGVLLLQPVRHLPFHYPVFQVVVIDQILLGMVIGVGHLPQIIHHVPDQEVADLLFAAYRGKLVFQQLQQLGDVEVILMQTG